MFFNEFQMQDLGSFLLSMLDVFKCEYELENVSYMMDSRHGDVFCDRYGTESHHEDQIESGN